MGKKRSRIKQARINEQQLLSQLLNTQQRESFDRLRAALIPNAYGFVASIIRHPISGLWQGWMSDGNTIICISARHDPDQASADVEAFLEASTHKDFRLEDVPLVQMKFDKEGDAPYLALPPDISETLLLYIQILYLLKG